MYNQPALAFVTVAMLIASGLARIVVEGVVGISDTQKFPADPSVILIEGKATTTSPALKK